MTGAFTAHVTASQLAELVLNERHQLIDGTVITASPGLEQRGSALRLIRNGLILSLWQMESRSYGTAATAWSTDDDSGSERPEVAGDVGNRAVDRLQVAEGAGVLHRE